MSTLRTSAPIGSWAIWLFRLQSLPSYWSAQSATWQVCGLFASLVMRSKSFLAIGPNAPLASTRSISSKAREYGAQAFLSSNSLGVFLGFCGRNRTGGLAREWLALDASGSLHFCQSAADHFAGILVCIVPRQKQDCFLPCPSSPAERGTDPAKKRKVQATLAATDPLVHCAQALLDLESADRYSFAKAGPSNPGEANRPSWAADYHIIIPPLTILFLTNIRIVASDTEYDRIRTTLRAVGQQYKKFEKKLGKIDHSWPACALEVCPALRDCTDASADSARSCMHAWASTHAIFWASSQKDSCASSACLVYFRPVTRTSM